MKPVIIVGAGGHGRVLADALLAARTEVLGFIDADPRLTGMSFLGLRVLGGDEVLAASRQDEVQLVLGVGSVGLPTTRRVLGEKLSSQGWRFATVVHPRAIVAPGAQLADGAQVMAGSVVQTGASVGVCAIVNTGALVDHDCEIGRFTHIAPGVTLSGGVVVGEGSHIGTGAVIIQGVRLGARTIVAAGAVVINDDPGEATLMGVPARRGVHP